MTRMLSCPFSSRDRTGPSTARLWPVALLLVSSVPRLSWAQEEDLHVCGVEAWAKVEAVHLYVAEDDGPQAVELLFSEGEVQPKLARIRMEGGAYRYFATDRFIQGGKPAGGGGFLRSHFLEFAPGLPLAPVFVYEWEWREEPLGGDAYLVRPVSSFGPQEWKPAPAGRVPLALARLSQIRQAFPPKVRYAVPDYLVSVPPLVVKRQPPGPPQNNLCTEPTRWAWCRIGGDKAWNGGKQGRADIRVAVIDSGLDPHPDLGAIGWEHGLNAEDPNYEPLACGPDKKKNENCYDALGHGTSVAGLIAAKPSDRPPYGVAHGVTLIPIRVLDKDGCGWTSALQRGIEHAGSLKVQVIAAAWGISVNHQGIKEAIRNASQSLFVTPSGQALQRVDLDTSATKLYPAAWQGEIQNLLVVGGSDRGDSWWSEAHFGQRTVHFAAPAEYIWTSFGQAEYGEAHGTSLAVGYAAGAAALFWSVNANSNPTTDSVQKALVDDTRIVTELARCCQGCGVLDVAKALGLDATTVQGLQPVGCP